MVLMVDCSTVDQWMMLLYLHKLPGKVNSGSKS
jgi:hypothetical protein